MRHAIRHRARPSQRSEPADKIVIAALDALVLDCAIAALADVPKHSRWIPNISYPQTPRLHGRWARSRNLEFSRQIEPLEVRPPCVKIIDHELHHKVFRPFLLISALKYEAAGTGVEDRHLAVENFFETQRLIEFLREIKVFRRHEWTGEFGSARNLLHRFLLRIRTTTWVVTDYPEPAAVDKRASRPQSRSDYAGRPPIRFRRYPRRRKRAPRGWPGRYPGARARMWDLLGRLYGG